MIDSETISTQVDRASAYYTDLLDADTISLKKGCAPLNKSRIKCLYRLITALNWDLDANIVDSVTENLYTILIKEIAPYTGGVLPVAPNVIIPGRTIIVTNPAFFLEGMDVYWEQLSATDGIDGNGGRSTYYNTILAGINPLMQKGVETLLYINKDYTLIPAGGFVLKAGGNLPYIYQGESLRITDYEVIGGSPINIPGERAPIIVADPSGSSYLTQAYLNATYLYPAYREADIVTLVASNLQYQRQDNNNPSTWTEMQINEAGS